MTENSQERAIGRLEGKIDAILAEQVRIRQSTEYLAHTPDRIARVEERLLKLEPIAAEFSKWRERGIGAIMLVSLISTAITLGLVAAWQKIITFFSGA